MVESSFRKGVVIACMIEYALTFHLCNTWGFVSSNKKAERGSCVRTLIQLKLPIGRSFNGKPPGAVSKSFHRFHLDMMWKTGSPCSFVVQVCCSKPWLTQQLWELLSTLDASEASQYRIAQPAALFCGLSIGWIPQRVPGQLCHNRDDGWFVLKWCKT